MHVRHAQMDPDPDLEITNRFLIDKRDEISGVDLILNQLLL